MSFLSALCGTQGRARARIAYYNVMLAGKASAAIHARLDEMLREQKPDIVFVSFYVTTHTTAILCAVPRDLMRSLRKQRCRTILDPTYAH